MSCLKRYEFPINRELLSSVKGAHGIYVDDLKARENLEKRKNVKNRKLRKRKKRTLKRMKV